MGREIWANAGLRLWLRLRQQVRVLKCSLWLSDYQVWYLRSTCGRWNGLQDSRMFWPLPNWWKLCCNCWGRTNIGFRLESISITEHRATLWKIGRWLFCLDLLALIVWWFNRWWRLGWLCSSSEASSRWPPMGLAILNQVSILFAIKKTGVISLFSRFQPIGQFEAAQRSFDRGARLQWGVRLRRVEPAQLHHRGDQGPDEEPA